jgi:regulator of G-protein signaling
LYIIAGGLQWFSIYLKSEFSEENLQFWIECEEFRLSDNLNFPVFARKICNEFIDFDAPREVRHRYICD